jgi:predicted unusual protein kinase regulating ubiquinone biosynthesis (AarF/ABC1/UbiB family)
MADEDGFTSRARRFARTTRAVGGLAAKVAGERYLGVNINRDKHAGDLRAALGGLKGPLMKVAQILATIPDALPKEYAEELRQLQADAPSMGPPFVRRRMAGELGAEWRQSFAEFDLKAAHAASLGQVHRASLHDGQDVAVKLQYPDMKAAVEADLKQLQIIIAVYRRYDSAINPENIQLEIAERLREELDYELEARNMALYRHMLRSEAAVQVPDAIPDLSTNRLLTMTWLTGQRLTDFDDAPVEARNQVAANMFRAWYVPFYEYGVIHGDPHFGNYSVAEDHSMNLLDFGCIRIFPPSFVLGVIELYEALRTNDRERAAHAYGIWGFGDLNNEALDVLNIWAEFIYAPLLEDKVRRIQDAETGHYGAEVANKVHQELKRIGGVTPPREFVLMDRAAIGLGSVFMRLKAELNWAEMFRDLTAGFDVEALTKRQSDALAVADLKPQ